MLVYLKSAMSGSSSGMSLPNILLNSICRFPGAFPLKTLSSVFREEVRRESFFVLLVVTVISGAESARFVAASTESLSGAGVGVQAAGFDSAEGLKDAH